MLSGEDRTEIELMNDKNLIVASLDDGDLRLLDQNEFTNTISKGIFAEEVMYQVFRHPLGDNKTSRIHCNAVLKEGRFVFSYLKTQEDEMGSVKNFRLTATNIVTEVRDMTISIIKSIEKNTKHRIKAIRTIFIYDRGRQVWFSGTNHCEVLHPLVRNPYSSQSISLNKSAYIVN
jgi:hypothetical protein